MQERKVTAGGEARKIKEKINPLVIG